MICKLFILCISVGLLTSLASAHNELRGRSGTSQFEAIDSERDLKKTARKATKATRSTKAPKAMKAPKKESCPTNIDRKSVTICHFDKGLFKTITVSKTDAEKRLKKKIKSYCGVCIEDRFTREAVLKNLPGQEGLEVHDDYEVEYNVTYHKAGFVSLAAAYKIINNVTCSSGAIKIQFSKPVQQTSLLSMFPLGSLLVVDGILFDLNCTVGEESSTGPLSQSGFLIIQGSKISEGGKTVTVNGMPASFMHIFQERNLTYHSLDKPGRRLAVANVEAQLCPNMTIAKSGSYSATLSCSIAGTVTARFKELKEIWQFGHMDLSFEIAFRLDVDLGANIALSSEEDLLEFSNEKPFIDVTVPNAGYELPEGIVNFVNTFLDLNLVAKAGLSLAVPIAFSAEGAIETELAFGMKSSLTTGEKSAKISIVGPWTALVASFSVTKNEPFKMNKPDWEEPAITREVKLDLFGGFKPQVKVDCFGFASASIGFYTGAELNAKVNIREPYPYIEAESGLPKVLGCTDCHSGEGELSLVAKTPFVTWSSFLDKAPKEKPLLELEARFPLLKFCFLDSPWVKPCGDVCCDNAATCTIAGGNKGSCDGTSSQCRANGLSGTCGVSLEECSAGQGSLQASGDCPTNTKCCIWDPVSVERPEIPGEIIIACRGGKRIFKVNINVIGRGGFGGNRSVPIEMIFSLDSSGSMSGDKIGRSKAASIEIIEKNLNPKLDFAGFVSWDESVMDELPLTNDFELLKTRINRTRVRLGTNLNVGISTAVEFLDASTLPAARRAILFLTDGNGNYAFCNDSSGSPAKDAANKGFKIYSVGLGTKAVIDKLQDMANCTNGLYIPSASAADLSAVFTDLFNGVLDSTSPLDVTATFTLMPGITYVPSGTNPLPTRFSTTMDGRTELVWEKIDGSKGLPAGDNYPISFEVTANSSGQVMDRLISGITFRDPEGRTGKVLPPLLFIDLESSDPCNTLI